jgi:hypothetical protein
VVGPRSRVRISVATGLEGSTSWGFGGAAPVKGNGNDAHALPRMKLPCIVWPVSTILEFRGAFRLVASDGDRLRNRSRGTWFCRCGHEAQAAHDKPKCETCAGGGDCGADCTLSRLLCPACGQSA